MLKPAACMHNHTEILIWRFSLQVHDGARMSYIQRPINNWSLHGLRQSDTVLDGTYVHYSKKAQKMSPGGGSKSRGSQGPTPIQVCPHRSMAPRISLVRCIIRLSVTASKSQYCIILCIISYNLYNNMYCFDCLSYFSRIDLDSNSVLSNLPV